MGHVATLRDLILPCAAPWRSTRVYTVSNEGVRCLLPHRRRGSAPPPHPPASPRPGPTPSWVRCALFVPAIPPDTPLAGGRSAGASYGAHQYTVQSCMSSALSLSCPLQCYDH